MVLVRMSLNITLILLTAISISLVAATVVANGIVVVAINAPLNTTYSTKSIFINVTASSYSEIDRVLAEIDHAYNVTLVRSGYSNFYTATEIMEEGQHFIRIFAYDVENNVNSQKTVYFTIALNKDLSLVVRGYTGIFYKTYDLAGHTWSNWRSLDGITVDAPSATIIGDTMYASVRGQNYDQIWVRSANLTSGALSDWTLIDGSTPSGPAIASKR